MGKESHRGHWETMWPHVKSGESGRAMKAHLHSGVTFCVPAPVYFLDVGQCNFCSVAGLCGL